jgi:hypothetical protein
MDIPSLGSVEEPRSRDVVRDVAETTSPSAMPAFVMYAPGEQVPCPRRSIVQIHQN